MSNGINMSEPPALARTLIEILSQFSIAREGDVVKRIGRNLGACWMWRTAGVSRPVRVVCPSPAGSHRPFAKNSAFREVGRECVLPRAQRWDAERREFRRRKYAVRGALRGRVELGTRDRREIGF